MGLAQKDQLICYFKLWKLLDNLIAICFDTTTCNNDWKAGCEALIEKEIRRAILWAACWHHIHDLHIKHVWETVIRNHDGPIKSLLKMLQDNWESFSHEKNRYYYF